jgi:hypothetical protein
MPPHFPSHSVPSNNHPHFSGCFVTHRRLKLKRPQTAKKFRAEIDKMYEEALAEETPKAKL